MLRKVPDLPGRISHWESWLVPGTCITKNLLFYTENIQELQGELFKIPESSRFKSIQEFFYIGRIWKVYLQILEILQEDYKLIFFKYFFNLWLL